MARFGCLALAVVVAMALLIFIVFLWSGWLNRPVGHAPATVNVVRDTPVSGQVRATTVAVWTGTWILALGGNDQPNLSSYAERATAIAIR